MLAQAIRDSYDPDQHVRNGIMRWLRTPDFETVCDMAFVEPDNMRDQIEQLVHSKPIIAKHYGQQLRMAILGE